MPRNKQSLAADLNAQVNGRSAADVMELALNTSELGPVALVSSFGAESVVLLHMLAVRDPGRPVIFLDTQMLFAETLVYQQEICERLGLRNLRIIAPQLGNADPDNTLHKRDPDACCALRKAEPLNRALKGYGSWITGRKRFQGGQRAHLEHIEVDTARNMFKINPLAHWRPEDIQTYMDENRLPRHPLVAQGYPSIGCAPCTAPTRAGEDPRAGRWKGKEKTECGIHLVDGRFVRQGETA